MNNQPNPAEPTQPSQIDSTTNKPAPPSIEGSGADVPNADAQRTASAVAHPQHTTLPKVPKPLMPESFPHPPRQGSSFVPTTIENVQHLLHSYRCAVRYDVIKKKVLVRGSLGAHTPDNIDNASLQRIISLAILNGMTTGPLPGFVAAIADAHPYNPVAEWISSKPWDGTDRIPDICATLVTREGFGDEFKQRIIRCWLLSCVAAAFKPSGFACRGVLTLQGAQGIGKTRWFASLVPDALLRDEVLRLGHHLDARNKDDVIAAISHWIVEIGELDSSFRKDIAALKGFLTSDRDKLRRPYGYVDSEYPRRTVFAATVNDENFLVDSTGNTRFWVLPVVAINYDHKIDMQQVFAQSLVAFQGGEKWWLDDDDQAVLESMNSQHRTVSAIRERIEGLLDLNRRSDPDLPKMTATEVLMHLDYKHPTNAQSKEATAALRDLLGAPKRIRGQNKWPIPLDETRQFGAGSAHSDYF